MSIVSTLVENAEKELQQDKEALATQTIKERIREIEYAERTLVKLRRQYETLVSKDLDDIYYDNAPG